jgi:hypothetical protein
LENPNLILFSCRYLSLGAQCFSFVLTKLSSMNYFGTVVKSLIRNPIQRHALAEDLKSVNIDFIRIQLGWVAGSIEHIPIDLFLEAISLLEKNVKMREWLEFFVKGVDTGLDAFGPVEPGVAAQQMLLKWSTFFSFVIRDMTVRNAVTFGSFFMLRTLVEDYIQYKIESKLLGVTQIVPDSLVVAAPPSQNIAIKTEVESPVSSNFSTTDSSPTDTTCQPLSLSK